MHSRPQSSPGALPKDHAGSSGYPAWIAVAGLVSAAVRGVHVNLHLGSLLVDPYWAGFYVTNFQDGFRRRALIGTLGRLLQPHGMSVILINLLAVGALAGVLFLFVRGFLRLTASLSTVSSLFLFAFFASALGSIFFEVLGDTLQIAFLVFALFTVLPALRIRSYAARSALAVVGFVLAFFIHEASAFLLAPCIPFVTGARVRLRDFALPCLLLVLMVGLSIHWSTLHTHLTYHAISLPKGMPLEDLAATPGFLELLRVELAADFRSKGQFALFLVKCASVLGLGLAGMVAAAQCMSFRNLNRCVTAVLAILLFSSPLWIIAHDWGRFLAYTFLLAVLCASTWPNLQLELFPSFADLLTLWMGRVAREGAFGGAALLLLLASPYYQSRIFGMHIRDLLSSLAIVAVGIFFWRSPPGVFASDELGEDRKLPVSLFSQIRTSSSQQERPPVTTTARS